MPDLSMLATPAALIDVDRLSRNIALLQARADSLGVRLRPHVKTTKCVQVVQRQVQAGAEGITVSTLREAEHFFQAGIADILYAVGVAPDKLPTVLDLRARGCRLQVLTDNPHTAQAIVQAGRAAREALEVWIELDVDGHRGGLAPDSDALVTVGRILHEGGMRVCGVLAHAGSSYGLDTPAALQRVAEQERHGAVQAAERLRAAGVPCPEVSVGSTPTALAASHLTGVTELRAGVYAFFDLVMRNVGVCRVEEIALSVLATVIGHQAEKGWAIVDAGWMALSRDRGTQQQKADFGYGQVCDAQGQPLPGYVVDSANQEHGIICRQANPDTDIETRLPIGTRVRILPNHACATGAQHPVYQAVMPDGAVQAWPRLHGW